MTAYVDLLATAGVVRGLIGPREVPRLWTRHIANCAVVAEDHDLVPDGARVVDVGSGAGLPGIVWSLVRPDLQVVLLEPLLRREQFLLEAVALLDLGQRVSVTRGRAEDSRLQLADIVTARAVANLATLIGWTLPLVREGGALVALKGSGVIDEVAAASVDLARWRAGQPRVLQLDPHGEWEATTVVVVAREPGPIVRESPRRGRKGDAK